MLSKIEKSLKALADRNRLRVANMLSQKAMCVCEITQILKLSQSTVSGHLRVLKEAGLVEDQKDGLWVEYRLCYDNFFNKDLLTLVLDTFSEDTTLTQERKIAQVTDRTIVCKR